MAGQQTTVGGITLMAPVSGVVMRIDQVPDPTFAQKMLGDGIAVDPVSEVLVAPCDGTVTQVHKASHALTMTAEDGSEILLHIGLETVLLKGQGFTPKVKDGDHVVAGQPLIEFDAEYLVHHASSLLVLMVVTSGGNLTLTTAGQAMVTAGRSALLSLRTAAGNGDGAPAETVGAPGGVMESRPLRILNPAGIHARPAALLVNTAKQFTSSIRLVKNGREANAKSVVSIMGLEVENDDTVSLTATGPDADAAISALEPLILSGLGEDVTAAPAPKPAAPPPKPAKPVSGDPNIMVGVSASPGVVTGQVFQLRHAEVTVPEKGRGIEVERASLLKALEESREEIYTLQEDLRNQSDPGKAAIFCAHLELLEDPELIDATQHGIGGGQSAGYAWKQAFTEQAETLAKLNNELLAGRANDIRDVGRRVLSHLAGVQRRAPEVPENVILIAENLTPSDTAGLDKSKVLGFATSEGSATSHVSILARSASIPAVAAVEERALEIPDRTVVILDGGRGELRLNPTPAEIEQVRTNQIEAAAQRERELKAAHEPAMTTDGSRVGVVANIGGQGEARQAIELGGEGVGLLRSEFLFLQRADAPSVDEQAAVYTTIAKTIGPDRCLIVRTLDVGGDKPLSYMPLPPEENPFLGIRGIRLNQIDTGLLTDQIRAVLSAATQTRLHIMFPMVATVEELRQARAIVEEEKKKQNIEAPVLIGIMVEVPSAAVLAEGLAKEVDFFSIGTNDLTQYTLAMDRGNPRLAKMTDSLHPAVLKLISATVEGAHKHGKWVGMCGGLASDTAAVPVLLGLGLDELSVTVAAIPAIKAAVRRQNMARCRELAKEVMAMLTATEVRARLERFVTEG